MLACSGVGWCVCRCMASFRAPLSASSASSPQSWHCGEWCIPPSELEVDGPLEAMIGGGLGSLQAWGSMGGAADCPYVAQRQVSIPCLGQSNSWTMQSTLGGGCVVAKRQGNTGCHVADRLSRSCHVAAEHTSSTPVPRGSRCQVAGQQCHQATSGRRRRTGAPTHTTLASTPQQLWLPPPVISGLG